MVFSLYLHRFLVAMVTPTYYSGSYYGKPGPNLHLTVLDVGLSHKVSGFLHT